MRLPRKELEPGEWQTDETGRRFRKLGEGCIEYEPTITVDGIEIPQSELAAYHERRRAAEQAAKEAAAKTPATPPRKNCPLMDGLHTDCTGEKCALYLKGGCTLAQISDRPPAKRTEGLQCPFSKYNYKCRTDCALYKGGCTLTGITTKNESEDK